MRLLWKWIVYKVLVVYDKSDIKFIISDCYNKLMFMLWVKMFLFLLNGGLFMILIFELIKLRVIVGRLWVRRLI